MKHLTSSLLLLTSSLLLFSCTQDSYEKGEGRYSQLMGDLVEAHVNSGGLMDYVVTDDDEKLPVEKPQHYSWMETTDTLYRVILYYARNGKEISVNSIGLALAPAITPLSEVKEGVMTDPIKVESIWMSNNKRFLNLGIYVKVGATDDETAVHKLGIVADTLMVNADNTRTLHLTLYHDQGGQPEYYSRRTFVCVPVFNVEADSIHLRANTYSGMIERTFKK